MATNPRTTDVTNPSAAASSIEHGDDDELDDYAIADITSSDPFTCVLALAKALATDGSIRRCPGHLDLSRCRNNLSTFALFRIACSLVHLKTLAFFSRDRHHSRAAPERAGVSVHDSFPEFRQIHAHAGEDEPLRRHEAEEEAAALEMAKLCVLASKLAYEDQGPAAEAVVNDQWNMKFIQFFDCWNEYLGARTTQALMFADADADASVIVVAFRGTEALNWQDWATDLDFSYYEIRGLGRVHMGFLEALGLGTRRDPSTLRAAGANLARKASSQDHHHDHRRRPNAADDRPTSGIDIDPSDKTLAYDAISGRLDELLEANPRAKVYVTGHSLGGALATLFVALRLFENQGSEDSPRLGGVFTFGQPRVGDEAFVDFVETRLGQLPRSDPRLRKYFRVVFWRDLVARVPSNSVLFRFEHVRPCHFYASTTRSQVLMEQPYNNWASNVLDPRSRFGAFLELVRSLNSDVSGTRVPTWLRLLTVLAPTVTSHFMAYYIDAIHTAPPSFLAALPL